MVLCGKGRSFNTIIELETIILNNWNDDARAGNIY
jgi:hypothetical protein